jgi:hypothetical protein
VKQRILIAMLSITLTNCGDCGNEAHVGSVVKLGKTGAICKTWEAEIVRGGLNNGSGGVSATAFNFTIEDQKLVDLVQDAFDKQYEIKVEAHDEAVTLCRSDSDGKFATAITRMDNLGHPLEIGPMVDPKESKREELLKKLKELQ